MLTAHPVEPDAWPGETTFPLAVISLEPEEIEVRSGLVFVDEVDDLDRLRLAVVEIASRRLGLIRYANAPNPGTEVHAGVTNGDAVAHLHGLLAYLGVGTEAVAWLSPRVSDPAG